MFKGCFSLKEIKFSNYIFENITDMNGILDNCTSLRELGLSSFNTAKVTDMNNMFCNCKSLIALLKCYKYGR